MTITEIVCTECDESPAEETPHCPNCGAEDPWEEQPTYEFNDDDLPIIFSYELYNDTYGLWRAFCHEYFGSSVKGKNVANLPSSFPRMKYCTTMLYFKVTESYNLEGPYLTKEEARND